MVALFVVRSPDSPGTVPMPRGLLLFVLLSSLYTLWRFQCWCVVLSSVSPPLVPCSSSFLPPELFSVRCAWRRCHRRRSARGKAENHGDVRFAVRAASRVSLFDEAVLFLYFLPQDSSPRRASSAAWRRPLLSDCLSLVYTHTHAHSCSFPPSLVSARSFSRSAFVARSQSKLFNVHVCVPH